MSIETAHIILIATALVFFVGYAGWEAANFAGAGGPWALARAGASLVAALALGVYLRAFVRSLRGR